MNKYPKYKPSGIPWISEIPEHWEVKKIKYISKNFDGKRIPLNSSQRGLIQGEIPYYGANGIVDYINDFIFEGEFILIGEDGAPFFIANRDVAFFVKGKFWVNNHAHILKIISSNCPKLYTYQLNCVDYHEYISGSTRDKLTQDQLSIIKLTIPPLPEQTAIANFLDEKTALIDELIAKKERLIELLEEEKNAVINEAVTGKAPITKNQTTKYKDSGIEWLGEIPEHWEIGKLKFNTTTIIDGTHFTPNYVDTGIPFLRVTDIQTKTINLAGVKYISEEEHKALIKRCYPQKGDVLLSKNGTIGITKVVDWEWEFSIFVSLCLLKFRETLQNKFFSLFFKSDIVDQQIKKSSKTTSVTNLHLDKIKELLICLPPPKEQTRIVQHIEKESTRIDKTIEKTKRLIELLKEYRTALISEVVTGKVKVI